MGSHRVGHNWGDSAVAASVSNIGLPMWLHSKKKKKKKKTCQCKRRRRHEFDPWVGKIPWRRKWHPTPEFLPGKKNPLNRGAWGGYSPCTKSWNDWLSPQANVCNTWPSLRTTVRLYTSGDSALQGTQGDVWRQFVITSRDGGCHLQPVGRGQRCCKHSTLQRTDPVHNVNGTEGEKRNTPLWFSWSNLCTTYLQGLCSQLSRTTRLSANLTSLR